METSVILLLFFCFVLFVNTVGFVHPTHSRFFKPRFANALQARRKQYGNDDDSLIIDAEIVSNGESTYNHSPDSSKSIFDKVSSKVSDTVGSVKNFIFGKSNRRDDDDDDDYEDDEDVYIDTDEIGNGRNEETSSSSQDMPVFPNLSARQSQSSADDNGEDMPVFPDLNAQSKFGSSRQEGFGDMDGLGEEFESLMKGLFGQGGNSLFTSGGGDMSGEFSGGLGDMLSSLMGGGMLGGGMSGFGGLGGLMGGMDQSGNSEAIQTSANDIIAQKMSLLQSYLPAGTTFEDLKFSTPSVASMATYVMNGRQSQQLTVVYNVQVRNGLPSQSLGQIQVQASVENGMVDVGQVVMVFPDGDAVDFMEGGGGGKKKGGRGGNNRNNRSKGRRNGFFGF